MTEAAFEQLFRAMHAPLCEVVDSYVRSQDVAEEIVQDLFFVMWMRRDSMPPAESLRAYLFAAARNRAVRHLRHLAVARRWAESAEHEGDAVAHAPLADAELEALEQRRELKRAIDALPPRTRLAMVLQWEHSMSNADIAEAMGISLKGVEKLLATARRQLRATIAR